MCSDLHFAALDIRQESSVHNTVLVAIAEKQNLLAGELWIIVK